MGLAWLTCGILAKMECYACGDVGLYLLNADLSVGVHRVQLKEGWRTINVVYTRDYFVGNLRMFEAYFVMLDEVHEVARDCK
jgi:hypothetical protein